MMKGLGQPAITTTMTEGARCGYGRPYFKGLPNHWIDYSSLCGLLLPGDRNLVHYFLLAPSSFTLLPGGSNCCYCKLAVTFPGSVTNFLDVEMKWKACRMFDDDSDDVLYRYASTEACSKVIGTQSG